MHLKLACAHPTITLFIVHSSLTCASPNLMWSASYLRYPDTLVSFWCKHNVSYSHFFISETMNTAFSFGLIYSIASISPSSSDPFLPDVVSKINPISLLIWSSHQTLFSSQVNYHKYIPWVQPNWATWLTVLTIRLSEWKDKRIELLLQTYFWSTRKNKWVK